MARTSNKLYLLAIICFILLSLSSLIAFISPAKGYELSIYGSTPLLVWIFLIASALGGVAIMVHQVYTKEYKSSHYWLVGLFILLMARITLLYIPMMRGYYAWNGDHLTNIGRVNDILLTGFTETDNFYPITHMLISAFTLISGLSVDIISNHSTAIFSAFYVISIYFLATRVLQSRSAQILATAAIGMVLFDSYNVYLMPNGWSLLYVPFILYLLFNKSGGYLVLLTAAVLICPFFHPLTSLVVIIMLLIITLSSYLSSAIRGKPLFFNEHSYITPLNAAFILCVALIAWILSFSVFRANIYGIVLAMTGRDTVNAMSNIMASLGKVNINGFGFIELIAKMMGSIIIFLVLLAVTIAILVINRKERNNNRTLIAIILIIIAIGFAYAAYLFHIVPGMQNIGSDRLISFLALLTPIPAGFALKYIMDKGRHIGAIVCISIIMLASLLSIFALYYSPYILQPNVQVTKMDANQIGWLADNMDNRTDITYIISPPFRYLDLLVGTTNQISLMSYHESLQLPAHFNYTAYPTLGESYLQDAYLTIPKQDRILYTTVWSAVGKFTDDDFNRLSVDPSVDTLYTNGEDNVYYIRAKAT